jgi:hypothetical protein
MLAVTELARDKTSLAVGTRILAGAFDLAFAAGHTPEGVSGESLPQLAREFAAQRSRQGEGRCQTHAFAVRRAFVGLEGAFGMGLVISGARPSDPGRREARRKGHVEVGKPDRYGVDAEGSECPGSAARPAERVMMRGKQEGGGTV